MFYLLTVHAMTKFEIDDPLSAFAVHGAGGIWGVLAAGIFSTNDNIKFAGYNDDIVNNGTGVRFAHQVSNFLRFFVSFFFS